MQVEQLVTPKSTNPPEASSTQRGGKRKQLSPDLTQEEEEDNEKRPRTDPLEEQREALIEEVTALIKDIIGEKSAALLELAKVQNTAKAIKELAPDLKRAQHRLELRVKQVINEKFKEATEDISTQGIAREHSYATVCSIFKGKEQAKQEALAAKKEAEDAQAMEIKQRIQTLPSLEDMVPLAREEWPRQVFDKTSTTRAGIAGNRNCRVFIAESEDRDAKTTNMIEQLSRMFPAVKCIDSLEQGGVAAASALITTSFAGEDGSSPLTDQRTLIVGRIKKEPSPLDFAEIMQKVAEEIKKTTINEERVLIRLPDSINVETARKIVEACWITGSVESHAEISMKPSASARKPRSEVKKPLRKHPQGTLVVDVT